MRWRAEFGNNHGVDVRSYYEVVVGSVRSSLWILLGAVLLVLLIACANVANLLLAAGMARRREFAIRLALGAGRGALARQLATESLLLAAVGGGLGILLARWMVGVFVVLAGNQLPRATTIAIDGRVLAFTVAISLLVGVFCGVWPLLRLRPRDLTGAVREGDTRTGERRRPAPRQRPGRRRDRHRLRIARRGWPARQEPAAPDRSRCRHSYGPHRVVRRRAPRSALRGT